MGSGKPQCWSPKVATQRIRAIARCDELHLSYKLHARERLTERGVVIGDILYVLKNGYVHDEAVPATRPGYNRYRMESLSPNSGRRKLGVVVIPDEQGKMLKVVTIMWIDENETKSGSIIGGGE